MTGLRTRLAPSPSSDRKSAHLGNIRTALYSYLVAKQSGGSFYIRLEDSDIARNVPGCAEGMIDDLKWLGIPPDEGYGTDNQPYAPYTQLEHTAHYMQMAQRLIEKGLAYKCFCTQADLEAEKAAWNKDHPKQPWVYDGRCRDRKDTPGTDFVIRFKAPKDGETIHDDLVFGRIVYPHKENYDFVLMRANGNGLYNFLSVLGDLQHKTDVVIRGRDHSGPNTLQQLLLYRAFDATPPKFAHLPMVNNMEGKKLAKRDGAFDVRELREQGYSPQAALSYIARLGWSYGDQELYTLEEMVEKFDITTVSRVDAKLDRTKHSAINYSFIKDAKYTSDTDYTHHLLPFISQLGLEIDQPSLLVLIPLVRSRARTFLEAASILQPIISPTITIDPEAEKQHLTLNNKETLQNFSRALSELPFWTEQSLRDKTNEWLSQVNLSLKDIGPMTRTALVGRTTSPELFQTIWAIGRQRTIERLSR